MRYACFKRRAAPLWFRYKEESVTFETTQNIFIEGGNLEVLKLLYKAYYGGVKKQTLAMTPLGHRCEG